MKQLLSLAIVFQLCSCDWHKPLTNRQKLDSVQVGMTMKEVMDIYGLKDTLNRSTVSGECGFVEDSITGELVPGEKGLSPLIDLMMNDSTYLFFSYGKLMMKPEHTWDEQKEDTAMMRILSSPPPMPNGL